MWGMKSGRPEENLKLNEEMVIEKGAKLVGEGIIYGISATILFAAHARERKKGAVKEKKEKAANAEQQELKELLRSLKETCRCLPHQHKLDSSTTAPAEIFQKRNFAFLVKITMIDSP